MSSALFHFNLKSSRGGIVVWCLFLFAYALLMVYLVQPMQDIADVVAQYLDTFGPLVAVFAGEMGSILNPDGTISLGKWLSLEYLALWPVIMSVYGVSFGSGVAAREVERGTMDMLLSQPVARHKIIIGKSLVFPLALTAIAVASIAGVLAGMAIVGTGSDMGGIILAFVPAILLALAVASYSLLFSCVFLEPRKAMLFAGSLTGLFYILNVLARTVGPLQWLGKLSIFHYYAPATIASGLTVDWVGIGIYLGIIAVGFSASIYIFQRRDISA